MWRWCWWIPLTVVMGFFIKFLFFNEGLVKEYTTTNIFLLVMVLVCIPKILFSLFSFIPKVGEYIGLAVSIGIIYIVIYGVTIGFTQMRVKHITYASSDVPKSFDGYKIVQFSDIHIGTFRGPYAHLIDESVDSINKQHADLVCFVGDIENFSPEELTPFKPALSSIKAKDGVMAIMGNHDYSAYVKVSNRERAEMVKTTRNTLRSFGWDILENECRIINHANDSIYVIGEENWGKPPFPQYGKINKAISGLPIKNGRIVNNDTTAFTLMLTHDPNAWEEHVMPVIYPDVTLSGHTHGTQFSLFGWSPATIMYKQWGGEYHKKNGLQDMMISVSTGLGGNFPFRFNMPREIVVITLKHKE